MKKKFDVLLNEQLDNMDTAELKSQYEVIKEITRDLAEARGRVVELETQLNQAVEELNFQLGLAVRKQLPKLGVNLDNGRCNINYRTRNLSCRPDLDRDIWVLEPNDFGKRFSRVHGNTIPLNDINRFAKMIAGHYQGRYKTLQ